MFFFLFFSYWNFKIQIFNSYSNTFIDMRMSGIEFYLSARTQIYKRYILGMHFPKYHGQANRIQFLAMQNAAHLCPLNRSNDRMQMFLAVFCWWKKKKNMRQQLVKFKKRRKQITSKTKRKIFIEKKKKIEKIQFFCCCFTNFLEFWPIGMENTQIILSW